MKPREKRFPRMIANLLVLAILLSLAPLGGLTTLAQADPVINEFVANHKDTDTHEFVEVYGDGSTDYGSFAVLEIEGDSTGAGVVDGVFSVGTTNANGFWTTGFLNNEIENGTITFLLVENFAGSAGDDLDTDNDGILDSTPWDREVDGVAVHDGDSSDHTYTGVVLDGGFDGNSNTPGGASRIPNGTDTDAVADWVRNAFDGAGLPGFPGTGVPGEALNTPGDTNQIIEPPANEPVIVDCGGELVAYQGNAATTIVTATDADGIVVDIAISGVDPAPAAGTITLGDLIPAGEVGGTASASVTVDADVPPDTYAVTITATNNDEPTPQTATCTLSVAVVEILKIGQVQGVVTDDDDGTEVRSPYAPESGNGYGETVVVQGVIYQRTLAFRSGPDSTYGFFVQNTAATADGDPLTSDGIFVYHSRYPTLLIEGGGYYTPQVGDEVILRGPVVEYYNFTQLSNPRLLTVVRGDVILDVEVSAAEVNPPDDLDDANRYWERREGMRVQVPAGSIVLNGRDVFASSFDSEVWLARGDSTIAQRTEPYERRSFRDAHPLDDLPGDFDNGNGYRILMGSMGVKFAADDDTVLLAPARTFDTLINAPVGGVYYTYGKYQIEVEQQPDLTPGIDPALNAPPQAFDRTLGYSVVTFNVENLYDYYDDPHDDCDFPTDPGCPDVDPPFDYVPPNNEVYQARLSEIAQQIVDDLHSPDIIMAQEAEDQDVCTLVGTTFNCGTTNNADGKPDTLQELAKVIADLGGPLYDAAFDRDGADDRGIISAYLYRTDRVELLPAEAGHAVLGDDPQVVYDDSAEPLPYNTDVQNPKVLNAVLPDWVTGDTDGDNVFTRAPQVGLFRMWRDGIGGSVFEDLYLIDNHFSSGPDGRVGQRTEQAAYNAAIVAALQAADPNAYVSVGGDLNVYPRPDDPFPPPDTSDQLAALYNQGMTNLWNPLVDQAPASAYGYVYQGQAQTLDQIFVAPPWLGELAQVNSAHINSDWPADHPSDGPRGTSDHDPVVAGYTLLPTLDRLEALVHYYDANGEITGNQTTRILLDRLDRARRFDSNGKYPAYEDQLWAFISQIWDKTPEFITEHAAQALEQETTLLLSLP